jgi:cytochrome c5
MKNLLFAAGLSLLIVAACSKKTVATKEPVIPKREPTWAPKHFSSDTVLKVDPQFSSDAAFAAQGKAIFETRCNRCHELKDVPGYTERSWAGILQTMAPRARLTETEKQQVAAYLKAYAKK